MANRNSPNTDGQIGMDDIIVNDPEVYALVKNWHTKKLRVSNANKQIKDAGDAKKDVVEKLELTDDIRRFRFVVEEEEVVFTIEAKPPAEKEKAMAASTRHFNHTLKLDIAEK